MYLLNKMEKGKEYELSSGGVHYKAKYIGVVEQYLWEMRCTADFNKLLFKGKDGNYLLAMPQFEVGNDEVHYYFKVEKNLGINNLVVTYKYKLQDKK